MKLLRFLVALKAAYQLGPQQVGLNLLYRIGLASGYFNRTGRMAFSSSPKTNLQMKKILPIPTKMEILRALGENGRQALIEEAEEILQGNFRQFGGNPVPIDITPTPPLFHWATHEKKKQHGDIKLIWEPARFGWAFCLGRAFHISGEERFAETFWEMFEKFIEANPVNMGPNWASGQEVGIRLMALVWAMHIFESSIHSTPQRQKTLAQALANHAARIPSTLLYARSQNNNHLLTESAALYTAGMALPKHPNAQEWVKTGKKWLCWCFKNQIDENGEYVQHSTNYHRLMLQSALWVHTIGETTGTTPLGNEEYQRLGMAVTWLASQLDEQSGKVPNLGANDGALIFPFSSAVFSDYRPVLQAGARAFLGDGRHIQNEEMSLWFGLADKHSSNNPPHTSQGIIHAKDSWASIRAMHYNSRPSHADQLHCELWWHGYNIARDAGTYRYNDSPPWDNSLTSTLVHNTVSINMAEQMTRAGRFLYLDWAHAEFVSTSTYSEDIIQQVLAKTSAYKKFGIEHTRSLSLTAKQTWQVLDVLTTNKIKVENQPAIFRLHWLLPDWDWQFERSNSTIKMTLNSPAGLISLHIGTNQAIHRAGIIRAGEMLVGDGELSPVFGWFSPTYNDKNPALSLSIEVKSNQNVTFLSEFTFPVME